MDKKDKGHCMACVCRLSFFSIVWPVLLRFKVANYPFGIFELFLTKICFRSMQKGVMTASDIDLVMTEGLGRRYAFMGVLETAYLNAHGT
jgi:L-gulonate 3-dehydrogenase